MLWCARLLAAACLGVCKPMGSGCAYVWVRDNRWSDACGSGELMGGMFGAQVRWDAVGLHREVGYASGDGRGVVRYGSAKWFNG